LVLLSHPWLIVVSVNAFILKLKYPQNIGPHLKIVIQRYSERLFNVLILNITNPDLVTKSRQSVVRKQHYKIKIKVDNRVE
jgi:hypothetical protein